MKTLLILLMIVCIFSLHACNNSKTSSTNDASSDTISTVVATEAATDPVNDFTGKKWKLIELMGRVVADSINGKVPSIMFNKEDSSYVANGGCNGLGGKFEWNTQTMEIHFTQGMSTMMACADMSVEDGLKNVFGSADNYSLNDTIFSLNKARMAPLARFRKMQ